MILNNNFLIQRKDNRKFKLTDCEKRKKNSFKIGHINRKQCKKLKAKHKYF